MKLKNAAHMTAKRGERTLVETTVAIEFAESWKPFNKSKISAKAMTGIISRRPSCMLKDYTLYDHGYVFAFIGRRLEIFIDIPPLDDFKRVGLFVE